MPTFTVSPQWTVDGLCRSSDSNASRAACRARIRTSARSASSPGASNDALAARRTTGGRRRVRLPRLRPPSAMIRLPMLNVDSWFVGVRDGDESAAKSAAPNALLLHSSAEGVFGAVIARRDNQRDRINLSESGCCWNEALKRHSEAFDIGRCGGVPCGMCEMFRTYASSRVLSTMIKPRPTRICRLKRSAGGVNARRPCGTHGRSAAESVDAAEHRMKIHNAMGGSCAGNQEERCDARSVVTSHG